MLKADGDKIRIQSVLTKELKAFADAEAEKLGLNLSAYIRMLIAKERERVKNN